LPVYYEEIDYILAGVYVFAVSVFAVSVLVVYEGVIRVGSMAATFFMAIFYQGLGLLSPSDGMLGRGMILGGQNTVSCKLIVLTNSSFLLPFTPSSF